MVFDQHQDSIAELLSRYPVKRSALLPLLNLAQRKEGYVSQAAMREIADILDITLPQVFETVTFYTMLSLKPTGKFHIQVCRSLMCALVGADDLLAWLKTHLEPGADGTTGDGQFTVSAVECLGSCATGPMMQVNDDYYERLTQDKIGQVVSDLKRTGDCSLKSGPFMMPERTDAAGGEVTVKTFEKILLRNMEQPGYTGSLADYERTGGYQALKKVLGGVPPADVIETVKQSGLRGRGGAGFPTGVKWGFIPKDHPGPKYLCCNADESEPGTFKDRQLMERDPHQILEGMAIACYAIGAQTAYIYIRGEFRLGATILRRAIAEARQAGHLGANIYGSGVTVNIHVHAGAGAYICGEETALLESLEGKRGKPRTKPPFPATHGLYQKPTVVNNVETLANVPHIVNRGGAWYAAIGAPPKSPGTRVFCLSGHVQRPGNYELPVNATFRDLIEKLGGGMRSDKPLKAFIPGGASAPFLTPDHLDVQLDFESVARAGSMSGSGGVTVMEEGTSMVWAALRLMEFFYHESCGKCTPCREGSAWIVQILQRILNNQGRQDDLQTLLDICGNIGGRTVCAFGDAEIAPVQSTLQYWRSEYDALIAEADARIASRKTIPVLSV